jgi:3D (Asp-Asp-Asp) domain-containing protein
MPKNIANPYTYTVGVRVKTALKKVFVFLCRYGVIHLNEAKYAVIGASLFVGFIYPLPAGITLADFEAESPVNAFSTPQTALVSVPGVNPAPAAVKKVYITAYSSTPEETDDTPFITASGKMVRDGIVASNFLAMGTKIRIPAIFGDKVFVVEDRMHPRMTNVVDVWMPTKDQAKQFGRTYAEIEILGEI